MCAVTPDFNLTVISLHIGIACPDRYMAQSCLVPFQAFAIVGAFVGGWLARQRRLELEGTNRKLRHINTELRRRQAEVVPSSPHASSASSCATTHLPDNLVLPDLLLFH